MKVKLGTLITMASGSSGGHSVINGRFGAILQTKTIKRGLSSPARERYKAYFKQIVNLWNSTTAAEKSSWYNSGESPSGRELFFIRNMNILQNFYTPILTYKKPSFTTTVFNSFSIQITNSHFLFVNWDIATPPNNQQEWIIRCTRAVPASVNPLKLPFISYRSIEETPTIHSDLTAFYSRDYGLLVAGGHLLAFQLIQFDRSSGGTNRTLTGLSFT